MIEFASHHGYRSREGWQDKLAANVVTVFQPAFIQKSTHFVLKLAFFKVRSSRLVNLEGTGQSRSMSIGAKEKLEQLSEPGKLLFDLIDA